MCASRAIFDAISRSITFISAFSKTDPIKITSGSTFTVGRNKLQVSYSDGDGNDLTLAVAR